MALYQENEPEGHEDADEVFDGCGDTWDENHSPSADEPDATTETQDDLDHPTKRQSGFGSIKSHFSQLQHARIIDLPLRHDCLRYLPHRCHPLIDDAVINAADLAFPNRVRKPHGPRAYPAAWDTPTMSFEASLRNESSA